MKKTNKMMLAVAILFAAVLHVAAQAVVVPPTDGTYFYIQFTRGTNLVLENEGSGIFTAGVMTAGSNQIKAADLVFGKAAQLWKAVSNGAGGYFIVSKAVDTDGTTQLAISWDATAGRYIVAAYPTISTPLYTTTTGITSNAAYLPACAIVRSTTATAGMNPAGGSNVGVTMADWAKNDDGDAVRFVPETSPKFLLQAYLTMLNTVSANASLNPGNHAADVIATFRTAIAAGQVVANNVAPTNIDCQTAFDNLKAALIAYNAAPFTIMPAISSADASNEKWYFFQGTRPANTYMTSTGAGASVFSKTVIPDDTQLWKIVPNTNTLGTLNGYALINKKTGEYLNTDLLNNVVLNTTPNMPVMNVVFNISNILTNGVARFWVENAGTTSASTTGFTFRLHAGDGVNNAKNWYGNRTDNSAWLLMDYSISLKTFLKDAITAANVIVNDPNVPVMTANGQYLYPAGVQATLATAVVVAQSVYDNATASDADIKAALVKLSGSVFLCKGSRSAVVVSTAANPRWFVIRNLFRTDAALNQNQVISANGILENGTLIYESKTNTNDQLWRFEANATGGVKIINAARPTLGIQRTIYNTPQKFAAVANASGYIIDILGTGYKLTDSIGNSLHGYNGNLITYNDGAGTATNWTIEERTLPLFLPQTITFGVIPVKTTGSAAFDLGATTNVAGFTLTYTSSNTAVATVSSTGTVTILTQGTTDITASNAGDATYARASVKQTLTVSIPTGVHNVADGINVEVKNGLIVLTGTNAPVKVFTVTGSEVNAKRALTPGIYIVKVAGKTVKVNVR